MTIRVWLIGFGLLFISVELLDWMLLQIGSSQPGGYWVVLGGLGLAAASNAKHLPKLGNTESEDDLIDGQGIAVEPSTVSRSKVHSLEPKQSSAKATKQALEEDTDQADDSISFRIRLPWR